MTHTLSSSHTHDRWNNALAPALEIESGDTVTFQCLDSSGGQVQPHFTAADFEKIDRNKIHTLTGPVFIKGAEPGDTLEIRIQEVKHLGWGWTSLIPGLGLIPERFSDYFLHIWKLEGDVTRSLPGVTLPLRPFCGIYGVAPAEPGEHRTRPPGVFGGNLDVKQLTAGAKLFLPVQVPGALFSTGDAHAAQGDGEVCINGIEMPSEPTLEFHLHKGRPLAEPMAETFQAPVDPLGYYTIISSDTEALPAAKRVVSRMVNLLMERHHLSAEHAYILCSVAMDLKISQWVNQPTVTISGHLGKSLFQA
jgi:acetamidase/formamidase